ncbi:transposase [Serratia symbiotica]|uniref:Transposase n=1 Tax=Serratia symbiotica TaxID=138074 RepID=A0A455VDT7_9GAMM|nr:transposase [Serratia symbiotica]BBI92152.1 transposase [Serratia symbiotica]
MDEKKLKALVAELAKGLKTDASLYRKLCKCPYSDNVLNQKGYEQWRKNLEYRYTAAGNVASDHCRAGKRHQN